MADKIVVQDTAKPGLDKVIGPGLSAGNKLLLVGLDPTGANPNDVVTFTGGTPAWAPQGSSVDTASNVGAGTGTVFKQKTLTNFEFKTLLAGSNITLTNNASDITIAATTGTPPNLPTGFTSAVQVISNAGTLTLAHGLGSTPRMSYVKLVCNSADNNYSAGDILFYFPGYTVSTDGRGVSIVPGAANLVIRYGANANPFPGTDKTSGAGVQLTSAKWDAYFVAFI